MAGKPLKKLIASNCLFCNADAFCFLTFTQKHNTKASTNFFSVGGYAATFLNMGLVGLCFANGLTPISDKYGWRYGMFAAVLHYYMVTTVPNLHGGFCLYNGGFTANLVCILLLPILEHHFKTKQQRLEARLTEAFSFE